MKTHMKTYLGFLLKAQFLLLASPALAQQNPLTPPKQAPKQVEAIFAGGCFWCVEADFEKLQGVIEAVSGYTGGHVKNPSYKQVSHGGTGHYEAVKIIYDPSKISYEKLLDYYWRHIDPTDAGGQFCDRGHSYKTAIFATPKQLKIAQNSKQKLQDSHVLKQKVVTKILPASKFYEAEKYHQDYYKKNPLRYTYYRKSCGRDKRIAKVWRQDEPH